MKTQTASVFGSRMAYVECGVGLPIVFLHGNPTSKYLWRDVMPIVEPQGRCIAPDLIGMGESSKLANSGSHRYGFLEHYRYIREFLYQVNATEDVILVVHDWGSALGFHWANEHRMSVRGICFMEAIVRPLTWTEWPDEARRIFQGFRSEAGESMIIENNLFVERVLPGSLVTPIKESDMAVYRAPFNNATEDRRPTLTWPRQIPISGEPPEVVNLVSAYADYLQSSDIPKLFINATPGAILVDEQREFCRSWPNLEEAQAHAGHFVPEDAPQAVGEAIRSWISAQVRS